MLKECVDVTATTDGLLVLWRLLIGDMSPYWLYSGVWRRRRRRRL